MQLTKDFTLEEFACHDKARTPVPTQYVANVKRVAQSLQVLRDYLKKPIVINSGYRTEEHNKAVGGSPNSQHKVGKAADICVEGMTPYQLHQTIERLIAEGKMQQGGLGLYNNFVHYDIRGVKTRWDNRRQKLAQASLAGQLLIIAAIVGSALYIYLQTK
ncbi:Peptidase M15 [Capnocytophaga haemolytica]|uniref:Peptidase M15 n=1 Tax=Capnocytophaga haemolytica TaxID=45243 RepID=A0AAX2GUQ5_9FLAO|nr:D-Ala-D-Ala carboxypeptidase family metallohydrolase [Capnocytophaga haemolytica]SFO12410.1 Peptidase M15 [Capnocytophaga haemolytica]SNV01660.1 Peptidase M15 [Capnocytophaga haemolytica]